MGEMNREIFTYIDNNKLKIEDIIKDYKNYVYTIIRNLYIKLPEEDVEEVALDVFITLWQNQNKLDINKSISAYLRGVTKNLMKYKYRQNKINLNIEDYEEHLIDFSNIDLVITQNEAQSILFTELRKQKKDDVDIFIKYYYENQNIKDICKIFNMSESKVKSKLFRIRKKLNMALKRKGYISYE